MTIGLLSPRLHLGKIDMQGGLIWVNGKVPAIIWGDENRDRGFMDLNCAVNAFGVRVAITHDDFTENPTTFDEYMETSFFGENIFPLLNGFLDFGGGYASPSRDVVNAAKAAGGKEDYGLFAIRSRLLLGIFYKKQFSGNKFISIGAGADMNFEMLMPSSVNWDMPITAGIGGFARMMIAF